MHADADLDVADFSQGAGVLPGYSGGSVAVFDEAGVVDDPGVWVDQVDGFGGQGLADGFDFPGRG